METRVSSKGQLVVPKEIRDRLNLKEGRRVRVEEIGGTIVVVPIPKNPVKALRGISKGLFKKDSVKLVRGLRKEWV